MSLFTYLSVEEATGMRKDRVQAAQFQLSLIFHDQSDRERQRIISRLSRTTNVSERADLMAELLTEQDRIKAELHTVEARIDALHKAGVTQRVNDRKAMDGA